MVRSEEVQGADLSCGSTTWGKSLAMQAGVPCCHSNFPNKPGYALVRERKKGKKKAILNEEDC